MRLQAHSSRQLLNNTGKNMFVIDINLIVMFKKFPEIF